MNDNVHYYSRFGLGCPKKTALSIGHDCKYCLKWIAPLGITDPRSYSRVFRGWSGIVQSRVSESAFRYPQIAVARGS